MSHKKPLLAPKFHMKMIEKSCPGSWFLRLGSNFKHMKRIKAYSGALLAAAALLPGCSEPEAQQPNIILFLVDDMGWQDTLVPFWKEKTPFNERYHTPGLERLASEGMIFTQAYASSVCSPTRVSLMSGMNAARYRVTNWTLRRNASKCLGWCGT